VNRDEINIPMSEIFRPKPSDLLEAVKIMEDERSHPIYIHCLRGRDRTGFVIAAYRIIHQGWDPEKAYQEAVDSGHNRWFYDSILGWKESLRLIASDKASVQAVH
jgi:protein tyrosine/serine phosphatase